jgi:hypothetical protein
MFNIRHFSFRVLSTSYLWALKFYCGRSKVHCELIDMCVHINVHTYVCVYVSQCGFLFIKFTYNIHFSWFLGHNPFYLITFSLNIFKYIESSVLVSHVSNLSLNHFQFFITFSFCLRDWGNHLNTGCQQLIWCLYLYWRFLHLMIALSFLINFLSLCVSYLLCHHLNYQP